MFNEEAFSRYLGFVSERHRIWERRQAGEPAPWTDDPVLAGRKFCNMFRVLDYGSQYLARELLSDIDLPSEEVLFRAFLYRMTNRPDPVEFFREEVGRAPLVEDLESGLLLNVWEDFAEGGGAFFGAAYRIHVGMENPGVVKYRWVVGLMADHFGPAAPNWLWPRFAKAETQEDRFAVLRSVPRIGDFLAMQMLTDYGYHPAGGDRENEFIIPGPGALRGIRRITDMDPVKVIRLARLETSLGETAAVLPLPQGGARALSLMDIQNTMCEYDKYERYLGKEVRARDYRPAHPGPQPKPYLPPHWT